MGTSAVSGVVRFAVLGRGMVSQALLPLQPSYLWPQLPLWPGAKVMCAASLAAAKCYGPVGTAAEAGGP